MSAFVLKLIKPICSFLSYHPQVEALKAADPTMDDESAAALAGSSWESLAWARELQPLRQIEVEGEEEGWMDREGD